jgi:AsmA protein
MPNSILLKRVAIALAVVVVVLVAAAAVFVASFDVNRYKSDIAQAVQTRTTRTLRFNGDLALTLLPSIGVKLPATTLSERGRDTTFAHLDSAQASVALLPLLRGQLQIDTLRIDGLKATLVRQADGRTNIDDLLGRTPGATPTTPKGDSGTATQIDEVRLRNADLTVRDLGAQRTVRLAGFDLQAGRYAPGARMPLEASAELSASDPKLNAKFKFDAELVWTAEGTLGGVHDLVLKADGSLNERPITVDAEAEHLVAGADALDVRQLKAALNATTPEGPLELRVTVPRLAVSAQQAKGERIDASVARRGTNPLELTLAITELKGNATRLEAGAVKLAGQSRTGERRVAIDGVVPLTASVEQRSARIERAAINFLVEDPTLPNKSVRLPLVVTAAIDIRRELINAQLESKAEGLNGRARVDLAGFDRKRVSFDIDADHIDVDRYFPAQGASKPGASTAAAGAAPTGKGGAAAGSKGDLSALRDVSGSGSLRIARLQARGIDATEVRVAAKATDGRIELAPVSARIYGGSVAGRIGIDARANRVASKGDLTGIDLRRAVGKVGARFALEGNANGTYDLAATLPQMERSLGGQIALNVRNGAIVGIDLNDIVGSASGFLLSRGRQSGALDERKRTEFTQLTGSARITDGVAVNDDLKAQTKQLNVAGSGRLDFPANRLDYTLRTQVTAVPAGSPDLLRSLTGVNVPVVVSGPLDQLSYSVDWGSVAAEVALRRATGGAGAPAVNQMLEGLGGLLGRGKKK